MSPLRALVVAGVSSGVGKTTVTLGLVEALRRRGRRVQAFKVGPDFIDPGFHALVTGRPSYNLDGWMCSRESVVATVATHAAAADVAVIEGVMGCFDGLDAKSEEGSTAQVAKWLGAPVVLVVDAGAMARSAGAVVLGFERFDPDLDVAAVIFNRVAGETHFGWLRESLEGACRSIPLGFVPARDSLALPERHLGLVTAAETGLAQEFLDGLASAVEQSVDLDRLLALATSRVEAVPPAAAERRLPSPARPRARIGVARDPAFQFYYPANFDLLCAAGAELVSWSPLRDAEVPEVDGLYLGGGYPELYAKALAANEAVRWAVREFADSGRPVYAECGGLMYLAEALEDEAGTLHPMVGLLPTIVRMTPKRLTLDYAEVEVIRETPLAPAGTIVRGHEFHASRIEEVPASVPRAYSVRMRRGQAPQAEGYLIGNALMSYIHLHFGANPRVAEHLVRSCQARRGA
ncbi:MAG: cobyrinate a,c-diamide synthase [Candidatus Rokubacteria bacterium]|nr:cobyrinate a,c-diamide synthase [Candidatus Rokubacteria bacterium]